MSNQDWTQDYRRLWEKLVPQRGQADTVQGELLRCIGKITDEAYRNGNENWDESFELMTRFIGQALDDPIAFADHERVKIRGAVERILMNPGSPDLSGPGSSYYYLAEQATKWCHHHPEPVPRKLNPKLQK
ncbi:uncharacterized protein sS8_4283 [Methylocaldum marinum]|uniref:Uncharacterized protein n=1 Tax=Methylocaldum marinum TaxID=1432792 RepID=A0A250KX22_9GAMM|nr:hypothetical protein [Methylocaldum marinum]BBA36213.1 uncharacterized protein sS8_4283 [Methylocaldum marinum]